METRGWSVAWQRCRISHVWLDICAGAVIVFKPTLYFHHPLQFDWVPYLFQPHPSLGDKLVINKRVWWHDFSPCRFYCFWLWPHAANTPSLARTTLKIRLHSVFQLSVFSRGGSAVVTASRNAFTVRLQTTTWCLRKPEAPDSSLRYSLYCDSDAENRDWWWNRNTWKHWRIQRGGGTATRQSLPLQKAKFK